MTPRRMTLYQASRPEARKGLRCVPLKFYKRVRRVVLSSYLCVEIKLPLAFLFMRVGQGILRLGISGLSFLIVGQDAAV